MNPADSPDPGKEKSAGPLGRERGADLTSITNGSRANRVAAFESDGRRVAIVAPDIEREAEDLADAVPLTARLALRVLCGLHSGSLRQLARDNEISIQRLCKAVQSLGRRLGFERHLLTAAHRAALADAARRQWARKRGAQ